MLRFNKLTVFLVCLTFLSILFKDNILSKTIIISPNQNYGVLVYDDIPAGGNTQVKLLDSTSRFDWQCNMIDSPIGYPYCGFQVFIGTDIQSGVDLSKFNELKLWLNYQGSGDTVRVALRHYDPLYSNPDDVGSTKFNSLDIKKEHLTPGISIDFRSFSVPTWWQLNRKLSHKLTIPDFTNIVILDIETGSNLKQGEHDFQLDKIELHGQWLSTENWYLSILIFWFSFSFLRILNRQLHLIKAIKQKDAREEELLKMNTILDIRGKKFLAKSETDSLTGAYNRAGAENKIAIAQKELKESNFSFAIILFDIDHFKFINDQYGHDAGDAVLIELSAKVQSNIRSSDYFARWGGEEFMIICRKTTLKTAAEIAEQLRELISSTLLVGDTMITASFGVAEVTSIADDAIDDAFKRADTALYKAKHNGRNKVELAQKRL